MTNWERLARAEAHPLRVQILVAIEAEGPKSPNQLRLLLDEQINTVAYHVTKLAEKGLIELDHTAPRRGALEHYYRASQSPMESKGGDK